MKKNALPGHLPASVAEFAAVIATRDQALARDAADPLAPLRAEFALPDGVIYLDGNSLGALPRRTAARLQQTITGEWGEGLIRSWNSAGWIDLAGEIGDRIAHPDRRRARRGLDRRLDLGQPVQGAERLRGPAEGGCAGAHARCFRSAATFRPTCTSPRASPSPPG